MTPEEAVRKFVALKQSLKDTEDQISELVPIIAGAAEFKLGSKTGHLVAAGVKMTVTQREYEKWDQAELAKVRAWRPEKFEQFFKAEYKPQSAKHTQSMMADPEFMAVVTNCRTTTKGTPGIVWEPLEEVE